MRALAFAVVVVVSSGGLYGCEAGKQLHRKRDPGVLVVAEAADVIALDPVIVTDSESVQVGELIYEGLVGWLTSRPTPLRLRYSKLPRVQTGRNACAALHRTTRCTPRQLL